MKHSLSGHLSTGEQAELFQRCAETSAVQAHMKQGIAASPGMQIAYVVKYAKSGKWIQLERHLSLMMSITEGCCSACGALRTVSTMHPTPTRCPTFQFFDSEPSWSIIPTTSCPDILGYCSPGKLPSFTIASHGRLHRLRPWWGFVFFGEGISLWTSSKSDLWNLPKPLHQCMKFLLKIRFRFISWTVPAYVTWFFGSGQSSCIESPATRHTSVKLECLEAGKICGKTTAKAPVSWILIWKLSPL